MVNLSDDGDVMGPSLKPVPGSSVWVFWSGSSISGLAGKAK